MQGNMNTHIDRMIAKWESMEPKTLEEEEREKILMLRWELDVDPESNYTLEELEEMNEERND